jgi:hypothetical protein
MRRLYDGFPSAPSAAVRFTGLALFLLAGGCLGSWAARAQANDMFPTRTGAEQRAKELQCSGAFAMGKEWMPCLNFDEYEKAVSREK